MIMRRVMRISEMCVIMTERRRRQNTLRDFRFIIIMVSLYLLGTEGNLIQVSPDGSERKKLPKSMIMTERPIPS